MQRNQIPNPATLGRGLDNNTLWVPDFNQSFYDKLIFSMEGVTALICSHNMTELEGVCDGVTVMTEGRSVWHGSMQRLRTVGRVVSVVVGAFLAAGVAAAKPGAGG